MPNRFDVLREDSPPRRTPRQDRPKEKPRQNRPRERPRIDIPAPVKAQLALCRKYKYDYRKLSNGNIENNSTLYLSTFVAHYHQVEKLFLDAIERAKKMPEIFGENFECDVRINLVRSYKEEYLGYAFADVSNPELYNVLTGRNPDGSERAEYVDDPNWVPPEKPAQKTVPDLNRSDSWADHMELEDQLAPTPPKIRRELPPLLILDDFEYDKEQREHLRTNETHGNISVSPAYIVPGVDPRYDDCSLYVSGLPECSSKDILESLYAIFARYARSDLPYKGRYRFYPKIEIRRSSKGVPYATVTYAHHYDAKFALLMLRKIRAKFGDKDIEMHVRHALANHR